LKLAALAWLCAITVLAPALAQDQRLPRQTPAQTMALQGIVRDLSGLGLGGVSLILRNLANEQTVSTATSGDGVFRFMKLPRAATSCKLRWTVSHASIKQL